MHAVREMRGRRGWRAARELALVSAAALAYAGVRALTEGRRADAVVNAWHLVRLEERLGIAWEIAIQSAFVDREAVVAAANWIYIFGHWPVIVVSAIVLYRRAPDSYLLLRNAIFLSAAIGFLFFALLPVAPPRLTSPFLVDTVLHESRSYRVLQPPSLTNQFAAVPSLHFGWNLLVGIVLFEATRRRSVRAFAVAMPVAMALAVLVTANHYVVDVVAGAAVVLVGLGVATWMRQPVPTLEARGPAAAVPRRAPSGQRPRRAA